MRKYRPSTYGELVTHLKDLERNRTLKVKQEVSDIQLLTMPLANVLKDVKNSFSRLFCATLNTGGNKDLIQITEGYDLERKVKTFEGSVVILSEKEFKELSELLLEQKKELARNPHQRSFLY